MESLTLALVSKVKFLALASRPQVLENWPVLGSRTTLFFELLKLCGATEKFFGKRFFVEIAWKIFVKTFFFGNRLKNFVKTFFFSLESTCACVLGPWPWPRAFLSLTSRVPVLGKALSLALASDFFVSLASSLVSSTLPLIKMPNISFINKYIINSEIRGKEEGGYSVLVNHPSLLSNIFLLAPQLFFFIKYKPNTLLRVSFIER